MLVKREHKTPKWLIVSCFILIGYFSMRLATLKELDGNFHLEQLNTVFMTIWKLNTPLIINKNTLLFTGFILIISAALFENERMKYHRNLEKNTYGSAEWGSPKDTEPIRDPVFTNNQIFTETEIISQDMHKSGRNRNVTLIGRPATGKSRYYFKPNLLNANGTVFSTDPKGELLRDTATPLVNKGYTIKVLNLREKWASNGYNPFKYIKKLPKEAYDIDSLSSDTFNEHLAEDDVLTLVNTIMVNTKSETIQTPTGDPFWEKGEMLFMQALFFYILSNYPKEEQNFATVMKLLTLAETADGESQSPLDKLFWAWEQKDPTNIGVLQYKNFKISAKSPKTMATIILLVAVRLGPFNVKEVKDMSMNDEMEFERIGMPDTGKVAYFIITDPNNSTFNFLASIFYTQVFSMIDANASKFDGSLPLPVDLYLDEFAQLGEIPRFLEMLAYVRSLNCGVTIGLQSLSQAKKQYKENWETMLDCCDYILFLGSRSKETLEYISTLLGKKTWYKKSSGHTYSRQQSSTHNWDEVGRELATVDELANLPKGYCILLVAGMHPFYSKLYELKHHPYYDDLYEPWNKEETAGNRYDHLEQIRMSEDEKHIKQIFTSIGLPFVTLDNELKMQRVSNGELKRMEKDIFLPEIFMKLTEEQKENI